MAYHGHFFCWYNISCPQPFRLEFLHITPSPSNALRNTTDQPDEHGIVIRPKNRAMLMQKMMMSNISSKGRISWPFFCSFKMFQMLNCRGMWCATNRNFIWNVKKTNIEDTNSSRKNILTDDIHGYVNPKPAARFFHISLRTDHLSQTADGRRFRLSL